jgi:hypothetical protein
VVQWDRLKPPQTSESIFNVEHLSGYKRLWNTTSNKNIK